jgi:general nucleoside transport system ATP-binding protein
MSPSASTSTGTSTTIRPDSRTVPPALELLGITKRFGSVQALRGADFTLASGELHALLGENGAGKSTLMHIANGMVRRDAGEVRVNGIARSIHSPRAARELGIGMVHQHFTSVPALTVSENIALFAGWSAGPGELRSRARRASEQVGLPLDPDQRAGRLSVGLKQRLEIVKAMAANARILLLDEPTGILAPAEAAELLAVVRRFTSGGGSAVLITHKLDEAIRAADRVTVLRQGSVTFTGTPATQTRDSLTRAMIGATPLLPLDAAVTPPSSPPSTTPPLLCLQAMEVSRESGYGIAVRATTLTIYPGEIVGVAAVEGNGQRELLRAVAGRMLPLRGRVEVTHPVGFIPEDRSTEGIIPELTLTENVVLGSRSGAPWLRHNRIQWSVARAHTSELLKDYAIVAAGPTAKAGSLSGGNQQKLVLARELFRHPKVIVAENPTRGLDISAAAAVHSRIRAAAEGGAAVLFHSGDLDEVLSLAHRVVVMVQGTLTEASRGASRHEVGSLMLDSRKP